MNKVNNFYLLKCYSTAKGINCLIINNEEFEVQKLRTGSNLDLKRLVKLFREKLDYNVTEQKNLDKKDFENAIEKFAEQCNKDNCDGLIVVIMTHGIGNEVITRDDQSIKVFKHYSSFIF